MLRARWIKIGMVCLCTMVLIAGQADKTTAAALEGINAQSAILYEATGGRVLYEKDAYTPRPMASTTKLMTALLAAESGDLSREVRVPDEAVRVEGSALGLRGGDFISMHDLIAGLLLCSGNDAANAIAYEVAGSIPDFARMMNERAARIGMKSAQFVTPSGLDAPGHAASAYDMALLGAEVLKHPVLADICRSKTMQIEMGNPKRKVTITNHNRLLSLYPDCIGLKTGFTKKSGRCLVSAAERDGVVLVAVTLNDGDDWNDHMAMFDHGFSLVESVTCPLPELPTLPVGGGTKTHLRITAEQTPRWVVPKGQGEKVTWEVHLPRFVIAPVAKGEKLGEIRYLLEGKELGTLPILAAEPVEARPLAGFGKRWGRLFLQMLRWLLGIE